MSGGAMSVPCRVFPATCKAMGLDNFAQKIWVAPLTRYPSSGGDRRDTGEDILDGGKSADAFL